MLRELRGLRWLRRVTWVCLVFPVVLTGLVVLANWLTGGGLRFFVSGAPWTHRFWSGQTSGAYVQTNVFTPRCLSSSLHIDGANLAPQPPH